MKKRNLSNTNKYLFFSSIFLLIFVFLNILIPSIMFIFNISINILSPILSLIITIFIILFLLKKNEILKLDFKTIFIAFAMPVIIIISSIILNGKVYDISWDGNSYHKVAIGMMIEGWNPLYEDMETFDESSNQPINIYSGNALWSNHYARASHIYSASIGSFTNNVESGKSINTILIISLFIFVISLLFDKTNKKTFSILFSLCMCTAPTICAQFLTNYVDILVYLCLFMLIATIFALEKSELLATKRELFLVYFMLLIILINIKFSSFGYAGIFCLGYYLWFIYRMFKKQIDNKYFWKFTGLSALAVLIGVFIVGLSVYPKNFIDHGNPFYPLMGEGKQDIMTANQPDYFKNKSGIEKFVIAIFSKAANISEASGLEAEYKLPFVLYKEELPEQASNDLRIAGNGVFFSGILIIALISLVMCIIKIYKKDKNKFILFIIPIFITFLMIFFLSEAWWARYFPQLHFIIFASLLLLSEYKTKLAKTILYTLIFIILINNFIVFSANVKNTYEHTYKYNTEDYILNNELKDNKCKLEIYTSYFDGALYNFKLNKRKQKIEFTKEMNDISLYKPYMGGYFYWRCVE